MKTKRSRVAWGLVLGLAASLVAGAYRPAEAEESAASAAAPPLSASDKAEIQELKQLVGDLNQKILVLERKTELDKEAAAAKEKTTPVIQFKDGFTLKTPDDKFQLKIGGWLATDFAWINSGKALESSFGKEQDGAGFRSARIKINGKLTDFVEFQTEYEFAGENGADTPAFFDTYVQFNGIPYIPGKAEGELRIGHFREPFSLEELTSQRNRTFQERSLLSVFNPSRNIGVQWSDALFGEEKQERLTYQIGAFKTTDNWPSSNDSDQDQGWAVTGRVTGLPWLADNGERLLHIGASYSHRNPDGAVLAWNVRPETRLALFRYVNADATAPAPPIAPFRLRDARADDVDLLNLEAALNFGPLLLQGEYTFAKVDTTFGGTRNFSGYYAQASYLLTGETHPYRYANGLFDRVRPKKNFGFKEGDGWGAWEVAARYAHVDLEDGPVRAGKQSSLTGGVNWYINPYTTASLNYIHNWVENDLVDDTFDVIQTRVRFDF
jgi:phosphate-selective porin OprO/OprP